MSWRPVSFALLLALAALITGSAAGTLIGVGGALLVALPGWVVLLRLRSPEGRIQLQNVATYGLSRWRKITRTRGTPPQAAVRDLLDQLTVLRLPARDRAVIVLLALAN